MKQLEQLRIKAYYVLIILWIILTLLLITAAVYFNLYEERLEKQQILFVASDKITEDIDKLISNTKESISFLPLLDNGFQSCTSELKKELQRTIFNIPFISAITIRDKSNKIICTTIPNDLHIKTGQKGNGITGPLHTSHDKPVFILTQRISDYNIDFYLLKSVIDNTLKTTSPYVQSVAIFDQTINKILTQVHRENRTSQWQTSHEKDYLNTDKLDKHDSLLHRDALHNIEGLHIILAGDQTKIAQLTVWYKLLSVAFVILTSVLIYFYTHRLINRRFSLHQAIINAVKQKKFFPEYQPIYDVNNSHVTGVEVLMRWRTESNEIIMPEIFVDDAEESGLIVPITLQIVEKTFNECKNILAENPDFYLALNLSAAHFLKPDFFKNFADLCDEYQIKSEQVLLEITERELISHQEYPIVEKMNELRSTGYSLAIDDFGTGHASINYLRHFPFNYLKIDRLFITAIGTGAVTEALNTSIIQMAKNLNLKIIAEGVERIEQLDYLHSNGVNLMQGWYFAKAMPIYKLIPFLKGADNE